MTLTLQIGLLMSRKAVRDGPSVSIIGVGKYFLYLQAASFIFLCLGSPRLSPT